LKGTMLEKLSVVSLKTLNGTMCVESHGRSLQKFMLSSHRVPVLFSNYIEHQIGQTGFLSFQYQI
jgi:hypothetical protein